MTVTESGCELYVRGQDWRKASPPREQSRLGTEARSACLRSGMHLALGQDCVALQLRERPAWPAEGKRKKKHDA